MLSKYEEYLRSKDWSNKRLRKLEAAEGKCDICGTKNYSNDVHHIKYSKDLKTVRIWDLRVLCRRCHDAVHQALKLNGKEIEKFEESSDRWRLTLLEIISKELLYGGVLNKIRKRLGLKCKPVKYNPSLKTTECDNYKKPKIQRVKNPEFKKQRIASKRLNAKTRQAEKMKKKKATRAAIEEANKRIEAGERMLL